MFVVLDGPDGAGKTSLAKRLAAELPNKLGREVLFTAEPYLPILRRWLSDRTVTHHELAVAFAHDRHVHLHDFVRPAVARGAIVICDRYVLSTIVYQSLHNDADTVRMLTSDAQDPNLTLVVDAPTDVCMARLANTGKLPDRFEAHRELQARVRAAYLCLASSRGYAVLDGTQSPDDLYADAERRVLDKLQWNGQPKPPVLAEGLLGC